MDGAQNPKPAERAFNIPPHTPPPLTPFLDPSSFSSTYLPIHILLHIFLHFSYLLIGHPPTLFPLSPCLPHFSICSFFISLLLRHLHLPPTLLPTIHLPPPPPSPFFAHPPPLLLPPHKADWACHALSELVRLLKSFNTLQPDHWASSTFSESESPYSPNTRNAQDFCLGDFWFSHIIDIHTVHTVLTHMVLVVAEIINSCNNHDSSFCDSASMFKIQ